MLSIEMRLVVTFDSGEQIVLPEFINGQFLRTLGEIANDGHKVKVIGALRSITGIGLRDAKYIVEAYQDMDSRDYQR